MMGSTKPVPEKSDNFGLMIVYPQLKDKNISGNPIIRAKSDL